MSILYLVALKIAFVLLLLIVGYFLCKRLGVRKFFPLFLIIVLSVSTYLIPPAQQKEPPPLTQEQKEAIIREQMTVSDWYTEYKKDIDQIDLNWQQYHKTLKAFSNDEISVQTVYMRFFELQKKTAVYREKYEKMQPPGDLRNENDELLAVVIEKTKSYALQQDLVVQQSLDTVTPKNLKTQEHTEQVRMLEKIMVLETPAPLNIAAEISRVKENLVIPGEK